MVKGHTKIIKCELCGIHTCVNFDMVKYDGKNYLCRETGYVFQEKDRIWDNEQSENVLGGMQLDHQDNIRNSKGIGFEYTNNSPYIQTEIESLEKIINAPEYKRIEIPKFRGLRKFPGYAYAPLENKTKTDRKAHYLNRQDYFWNIFQNTVLNIIPNSSKIIQQQLNLLIETLKSDPGLKNFVWNTVQGALAKNEKWSGETNKAFNIIAFNFFRRKCIEIVDCAAEFSYLKSFGGQFISHSIFKFVFLIAWGLTKQKFPQDDVFRRSFWDIFEKTAFFTKTEIFAENWTRSPNSATYMKMNNLKEQIIQIDSSSSTQMNRVSIIMNKYAQYCEKYHLINESNWQTVIPTFFRTEIYSLDFKNQIIKHYLGPHFDLFISSPLEKIDEFINTTPIPIKKKIRTALLMHLISEKKLNAIRQTDPDLFMAIFSIFEHEICNQLCQIWKTHTTVPKKIKSQLLKKILPTSLRKSIPPEIKCILKMMKIQFLTQWLDIKNPLDNFMLMKFHNKYENYLRKLLKLFTERLDLSKDFVYTPHIRSGQKMEIQIVGSLIEN